MTIADEDMRDLPPLNVVVTSLELPDAVMATYRTMARELFAAIEGRSIEAASPLIATGKLAQLANGFLYDAGANDPVFVHSRNIDWLREVGREPRRRAAPHGLRVYRRPANHPARFRSRAGARRSRTRLRGSSRPGMRRQHVTTHVCVAAATVDEMKRDRVIGKMRAQEAFKRHLERV